MKPTALNLFVNYLIAAIWLLNGLICKVLNLVPRHQLIVEKILQVENGRLITIIIGVSEIIMAIWIISGFRRNLNMITQIGVILLMNLIEFWKVPELLLYGKYNLVLAILLCLVIFLNGNRYKKSNV